ncbi:MAG TPA: hypothetical protein VHV51_04860 [Polyangiaceae bacterium]|jgi:hypothetical protein|nr:hypothetical protein [Polyangiaceae bacterium]
MSIIRTHVVAWVVLASLALTLDGCAVIGGIFKAGVWVGVIAVVLVIALILGVVRAIAGSS